METLADIVGVDYHKLCVLDLLGYYYKKITPTNQGMGKIDKKKISLIMRGFYLGSRLDGKMGVAVNMDYIDKATDQIISILNKHPKTKEERG